MELSFSDFTIRAFDREWKTSRCLLVNIPYFRALFFRWNTNGENPSVFNMDLSSVPDATFESFDHLMAHLNVISGVKECPCKVEKEARILVGSRSLSKFLAWDDMHSHVMHTLLHYHESMSLKWLADAYVYWTDTEDVESEQVRYIRLSRVLEEFSKREPSDQLEIKNTSLFEDASRRGLAEHQPDSDIEILGDSKWKLKDASTNTISLVRNLKASQSSTVFEINADLRIELSFDVQYCSSSTAKSFIKCTLTLERGDPDTFWEIADNAKLCIKRHDRGYAIVSFKFMEAGECHNASEIQKKASKGGEYNLVKVMFVSTKIDTFDGPFRITLFDVPLGDREKDGKKRKAEVEAPRG